MRISTNCGHLQKPPPRIGNFTIITYCTFLFHIEAFVISYFSNQCKHRSQYESLSLSVCALICFIVPFKHINQVHIELSIKVLNCFILYAYVSGHVQMQTFYIKNENMKLVLFSIVFNFASLPKGRDFHLTLLLFQSYETFVILIRESLLMVAKLNLRHAKFWLSQS